jgi:Zn-dependent peptidase ImmA (M78 family)
MNIPAKVKIGWREYEVIQGEHRSGDGGGDLYGEIQYEQNTIFIWDKLDHDNKAVTLLHEIIHGLFYMCGRTDLRNDEGLVTAVSEALYQIMLDNPDMFRPLAD